MARRRPAKKTPSSKAGKVPADDVVPRVYRDMLVDATSSSPTQTNEDGRVIKRRRVKGRIVTQSKEDLVVPQSEQSGDGGHDSELNDAFKTDQPNLQQIFQTESEDSADSNVDWEEIELQHPAAASDHEHHEPEDLNIVLGGENSEHTSAHGGMAKRRPITAEEKLLRLEIHKLHLCSLMAHVFLRNHWCNDGDIHSVLKGLLTKKTAIYLNADESLSQFQRSRSFMDGLTQASEAFRGRFKIIARGMAKPMWADSPETLAQLQPPEDIDLPMHLSDFRDAATTLKASRDVGVQLFCALLRSIGVEARLVCSLQLLPFQPAPKVTISQARRRTPQTLGPAGRLTTQHQESESDANSDGPGSAVESSGPGEGHLRSDPDKPTIAEITRSGPSSVGVPLRSKKYPQRPIRESKYPVYWVEAFNEAMQKWVPVDPLVTRTIAKPSKFEPPAGEPENHMNYVIAFEDDGSARDVTRRYTKAYNAKTRRERVEITDRGERWLRKVMKMYRRPHVLNRDQVEDAELAAKEAAEPMPRNVQDFKDHPYYALERHLKRHEVIHPKREVGKVGAGRSSSANTLESIYRRRDVHMVKSADKWYRLGREIKPGEQPLKRVPARRTRDQILEPEDPDAGFEENAGVALYAAHQTKLYSAPPVQNGRVPKNVYGNLDIYVPSMIPSGGTHIAHPETARAARILAIDYADAVTGFTFKGRHGTAVTKGAVVASEYAEAVEEVLRAFDDERVRTEEERRSKEALRMWRRLLAGLRIRERIEGYEVEGERDAASGRGMADTEDEDWDDSIEGGGFLPDRDGEEIAQPTLGRGLMPRGLADLADEGGGFVAEESDEDLGIHDEEMTTPFQARDAFLNNTEDDDGGGFLVNDDEADAEEALREINAKHTESSDIRSTNVRRESSSADISSSEEEGGGFMPFIFTTNSAPPPTPPQTEKANTTTSPSHHIPHPPSTQATTTTTNPSPPPLQQAFPSLSTSELEEARLLQQLYESGGMTQHPQSHSPSQPSITKDNARTDPVNDHEEQLEEQARDVSEGLGEEYVTGDDNMMEEEDVEEEGDAEKDHSSEDEKGSLLSNDPEDEDAEPEWLA